MIRGTKRKYTSAPNKRFDVGASIHNRFDIEVINSVSGELKQKAFAENVICNQLWTRLLSGYMWNSYIHYGDGFGTPSASDTSLFSHLGTKESDIYDLKYDYNNNVFACTKKVVLDETVAVGKTLTEVGIAYSNGSSTLVTHAMLKDMNGNSVSLEKSETDIFNIYATVFIHFTLPSEHVRIIGQYRINSGWYVSGMMQFFSGITTSPTIDVPTMIGTVPHVTATSKTVTPTYDSANRKITYTATRLGASEFNLGGLSSLMLRTQQINGGGSANMIFDIDPNDGWFGGNHIEAETIGTGDGTTVDFATKFGYASNVKAYVDGIETPVTVDYVNHALHQLQSSYTGLKNPMFSYFRILQAPEVGYGYSNPKTHYAAPIVYFDNSYCCGRQSEYPSIFENIIYKTHGVSSFYGPRSIIKASNDLRNWVTLSDSSVTTEYVTVTVPEEYQHYRYWSIQNQLTNVLTPASRRSITAYANKDLATMTNNIHFSEPPASGAVITVDYDAVCIAKDENHVFDFSVTFTFNEYVGV